MILSNFNPVFPPSSVLLKVSSKFGNPRYYSIIPYSKSEGMHIYSVTSSPSSRKLFLFESYYPKEYQCCEFVFPFPSCLAIFFCWELFHTQNYIKSCISKHCNVPTLNRKAFRCFIYKLLEQHITIHDSLRLPGNLNEAGHDFYARSLRTKQIFTYKPYTTSTHPSTFDNHEDERS